MTSSATNLPKASQSRASAAAQYASTVLCASVMSSPRLVIGPTGVVTRHVHGLGGWGSPSRDGHAYVARHLGAVRGEGREAGSLARVEAPGAAVLDRDLDHPRTGRHEDDGLTRAHHTDADGADEEA